MALRYCLIVESDDTTSTLVQQYTGRLPFLKATDIARTAEEALALIHQRTYDIILLRLDLPGLNGLDLLDTMPGIKPVIALAETDTQAAACYERGVVDYLQLPVTYLRFVKAINRVIDARPGPGPQPDIFLKSGRQMQRFTPGQIAYIEAAGMFSKIWVGTENRLVSSLLTDLLPQLPTHQFVRVHKSYIVNLDRVTSFTHTHLYTDSAEIPIGMAYRERLQRMLGQD